MINCRTAYPFFTCTVTKALVSPWKEEQYEHLDEAEIQKVDKTVGEVMIWMNSKMNQQSKQSLTVDPVVKAAEVIAKTRVSLYILVKFFVLIALSGNVCTRALAVVLCRLFVLLACTWTMGIWMKR